MMIATASKWNPLLAWRWERSSAYTFTNIFLLLCLGYAIWGTIERLSTEGSVTFPEVYGLRRQMLAFIGIIIVQGGTALGCLRATMRALRTRVPDVCDATPITERQARFALVDWPMYKVFGAGLLGILLFVLATPWGWSESGWFLYVLQMEKTPSGTDVVGVFLLAVWGGVWWVFRIIQLLVMRRFMYARLLTLLTAGIVFMFWSHAKGGSNEDELLLMIFVLTIILLFASVLLFPLIRIRRADEAPT